MNKCHFIFSILSLFILCSGTTMANEVKPFQKGIYSVGSTNMEVASEYANIGDKVMHEYLLGRPQTPNSKGYIADILKYPKEAWLTDVLIPKQPELYGTTSGKKLPILTYLTYPSATKLQSQPYAFPYNESEFGTFEDMLAPGETPDFADPKERYPLIILSHGSSSHGIYNIKHAHSLASLGYIVAVIFYGDDRNAKDNTFDNLAFLRPLITKSVLDSILDSDEFGNHIDSKNIGISGHSFGGTTALAVTGGSYLGYSTTVYDKRITAGVIAAPWVGGNYNGRDFFAFGADNISLKNVTTPMLCLFGTKDESTLSSFILPATKQLSGSSYVVELVDQPHIFEPGSWEDKSNWELYFFDAYLKGNKNSLAILKNAKSMSGGNKDIQLFDYQKNIK